jgi:type IV pilus assembly protein PilV
MKKSICSESRGLGLSNNQGFTLLEVVMAVFLVAGGLLAYGALTGSLMEKNVRNTRDSIATTLAQDKIEELRNAVLDANDFSGAMGNNRVFIGGIWDDLATPEEKLDADGNTVGNLQYARTWTVSQADPTVIGSSGGGNHLYDVQVTVAWVDKSSQAVTLNTRISE